VSATNIVIDLDGTIYRGNQLISHAKSFFEMLNKNAINYRCFTNCSKRVPNELVVYLKEMGLDVRENNIVTSGCIARSYFQSINKRVTVYAIGSVSFKEYIRTDNVDLLYGTEISADYVIVGFCTDFTYDDLARALWHILNGAEFIATNVDDAIPAGDSIVPHTGSICAFLEYASKQKPVNLGKPSEYAGNFFRRIFDKDSGSDSEQVFVIGDRIDTDMLFAKNNGFVGCLVLTGVTSRKNADKQNYYNIFNDLHDLCKFIGI